MKKHTLIGRQEEYALLEGEYNLRSSRLVVIYGRRRIGKSTLVENFMGTKPHLHFEGLEGLSTQEQILEFTKDLAKQIDDPLLKKVTFKEWTEVFDYLTSYITRSKNKLVIFFDEFQWLAANQTKLVSLVKKYWDQHWKNSSVLLILCGSIASFMVKKVIRSSALYGRINKELLLTALAPQETPLLLRPRRSSIENLQYNMILGGIPKYWEEIQANRSVPQNINNLFFKSIGYLFNDYEKFFYSQFKEHKTYEEIVKHLEKPLSMEELSKKIKFSTGGGLKFYLNTLESAGFIKSYVPFDKDETSKLKKYRLIDEALRFYFKFVTPNKKIVSENKSQNLFERITKNQWEVYLGFAFENFCMKNALLIAREMGFEDEVISYGPYFKRQSEGFQVDLVYKRKDKVITICEIKFYNKPVSAAVINEVERKVSLLKIPKSHALEKVLITANSAEDSLQKAGYFHHIINLQDWF